MTARWGVEYHFSWAPRPGDRLRRLALADRFADLNPVAYTDTDATVGVAILDPNVRLRVHPHGMTLSSSVVDVGVEELAAAGAIVVDVLGPAEFELKNMRTTHTSTLKADRAAATRSFAQHAVGAVPSGFAAFDASVLSDIQSDRGHVQVEYGVVTAEELRERLTGEVRGRIPGGSLAPWLPPGAKLPRLSTFIDMQWITIEPVIIEAWADAVEQMAAQDHDTNLLAGAVARNVEKLTRATHGRTA